MTSPWNTFANEQRPAQAWQNAPQGGTTTYAPQAAPAFAPTQAMPAAQQFPAPPRFDYGYPQPFPQAPKPNRTALIVSLIVAAVLLIGGGVAAFLLLTKKDEPVSPVTPVTTSSSSQTATSTESPVSSPTTTSHPTTTSDPSTEVTTTNGSTETGNGDQATAEGLVQTWVDFLNEGDVATASALVCEAQRDEFAGGSAPTGTLQVDSVVADGDNYVVTVSLVEDPSSQYELVMWPTNTGYFLICDGPLSETDLNW